MFGKTITNSQGKVVPVRLIGEQHVLEDLKYIPSMKDWLSNMKVERWMLFTNRLTDEENQSLMNNEPTEISIKARK